MDAETEQPVTDAFLFLSSTTKGTSSGANGYADFSFLKDQHADLVISHLNYEIKVIPHHQFADVINNGSILLTPSSNQLEEIIVQSSRSNQRKKRLKQFRDVLIGSEIGAKKCKILNPEVLLFDERAGSLIASAQEPLQISNKHLGYNITLYLNEFILDQDGSFTYKSKAHFTDFDEVSKKQLSNREKAYRKSYRHFLREWISSDTSTNEYYTTSQKNYWMGNFIALPEEAPLPSLIWNPEVELYALRFTEFLNIEDKEIKEVTYSKGTSIGGLESQRFNNSQATEKVQSQLALSQFYKLSDALWIDLYGNIINKKDVQEYGYWAKWRVAHELPIDYREPLPKPVRDHPASSVFKDMTALIYATDKQELSEAKNSIRTKLSPAHIPPLLDLLRMASDSTIQGFIKTLLTEQEVVRLNLTSYYDALHSLWGYDPIYNEDYLKIKSEIYRHVDPIFQSYFSEATESKIRLDEIVWGGVTSNSIPTLDRPNITNITDAVHMDNSDVVFGVVHNGQARAYPKKILGWHEFARDTLGGEAISLVYCTLCGVAIPYLSSSSWGEHKLSTSGFLYRSNKLMVDAETKSLWNSITGTPVLGELTDKNIQLKALSITTKTWGEWKNENPNTTVLSDQTSYKRNYLEGEAYKEYYSHDGLIFPVSHRDTRLKNKTEVIGLRPSTNLPSPVAIQLSGWKQGRWEQRNINGVNVLIIYGPNNSVQVFVINQHNFVSRDGDNYIDSNGNTYTLKDNLLKFESGESLSSHPVHRIFWFAWINQHPNTVLIRPDQD